jgi:hypothetical protein
MQVVPLGKEHDPVSIAVQAGTNGACRDLIHAWQHSTAQHTGQHSMCDSKAQDSAAGPGKAGEHQAFGHGSTLLAIVLREALEGSTTPHNSHQPFVNTTFLLPPSPQRTPVTDAVKQAA